LSMGSDGQTVFLLSPARCDGKAPQMVLRENASSRSRRGSGNRVLPSASVSLPKRPLLPRQADVQPDVRARARHHPGPRLLGADEILTLEACADRGDRSHLRGPSFREPLERDAVELGGVSAARTACPAREHRDREVRGPDRAPSRREASLPSAFVGRGDMSRGGLLLRCVLDRQELEYVPIAGAVRRGPRPPRLTPLR